MRLILEGRQGKTVIVEGNTVQIIKKGGLFASEREKVLPIRSITSVEVKKPGPFIVGFIQFSIAGGKSRDSSFKISGGAFDAAQDENSVLFETADNYEIALKIKEYIQNLAEGDRADASQSSSTADEILKLKNLVDQGILTPAEFDAKKKQLLGM